MPWINQNKCTGCKLCIKECPVDAIFMQDEKVKIDMDKCIRCGKCHDICPHEAIRHDSEKISFDVKENMKKTKELMKNFRSKEEEKAFLGRMIKHFKKEKIVVENTLEEINKLLKKE